MHCMRVGATKSCIRGQVKQPDRIPGSMLQGPYVASGVAPMSRPHMHEVRPSMCVRINRPMRQLEPTNTYISEKFPAPG